MHPMFVKLFLETDADDLQADQEKRRTASRTKRNRTRTAARVRATVRDRQPRR